MQHHYHHHYSTFHVETGPIIIFTTVTSSSTSITTFRFRKNPARNRAAVGELPRRFESR
ncbi:hypothetical protein PVAG01_06669 [Phlyctema vagabunda]|uniref:Uncharacterized protein n=1 Tax=Phlyctema vagabunda TaxID=108571 RepID=A0ABR4PGX7_9HELO